MPDGNDDGDRGMAGFVGKLTLFSVAGLIAAAAFAGMGLFMFNMGRDMSMMTTSVVQMGGDVTCMATDMRRAWWRVRPACRRISRRCVPGWRR